MRRAMLALLALGALVVPAAAQAPGARTIILSTTTSTQDSGLLDVLVPLFEKQTGYTVKAISVGTGQALALAARGEADVTLAHAPALEKKYVAEGKSHLTIAIGCTGGRHRSVAIAEHLGKRYTERDDAFVEVAHRDMNL